MPSQDPYYRLLSYYQSPRGFHRICVTGAASQQGILTSLAPGSAHLKLACILKLRSVFPELVMLLDVELRTSSELSPPSILRLSPIPTYMLQGEPKPRVAFHVNVGDYYDLMPRNSHTSNSFIEKKIHVHSPRIPRKRRFKTGLYIKHANSFRNFVFYIYGRFDMATCHINIETSYMLQNSI